MNNAEFNKLAEKHSTRLLFSVGISFVLIVALIAVHMAHLNWRYLEANRATFIMSIIFAVIAVILIVICALKKKIYLIEYIGLAIVMSFCFYCVHGVGFVRADLMKYGTGVLVVAYLIGTYVFHTYYPKYVYKKSK